MSLFTSTATLLGGSMKRDPPYEAASQTRCGVMTDGLPPRFHFRRATAAHVESAPMTASCPFVLTAGEPAGIGPDLCLLMARGAQPHAVIAIASLELLKSRADQLGLAIQLLPVGPEAWPQTPAAAGSLYVWD